MFHMAVTNFPIPTTAPRSHRRSVMYLAAMCVVVASVLLSAKASAATERLIGEAGETIGFLQREGAKTFVKDRCFQTLGYVTKDGTFTDTGIRKARSPFPYLLLESERNCARDMPRR